MIIKGRHTIIGSTAINHWFSDFTRIPKDLDIAVEEMQDKVVDKSSGEIVERLYQPIVFKFADERGIGIGEYLSPDLLLTLKVSHLFWDINWDKHMYDVQFLLSRGCKINQDLLDRLIEFWKEYLPKIRRSKLDQNKDEFFMNSVNKNESDHDDLHYMLCDVPAFTKILKDGAEVDTCEEKFNSLSFEEKCDVVMEETYVMAYERFHAVPYRVGANKQLKSNIIKHFPLYIALFAIENYKKFVTTRYDYVSVINENIVKHGREDLKRIKTY